MKKKIKIKVLNWCIKHLWNGLTEEDVLVVVGKNVIMRGEMVSPEARSEITSGAKAFINFPFWNLLRQEMKIAANRKIYNESVTVDDMIFGKAVLWTLDVMQKKVENLSKL